MNRNLVYNPLWFILIITLPIHKGFCSKRLYPCEICHYIGIISGCMFFSRITKKPVFVVILRIEKWELLLVYNVITVQI